MIFWRIVSMLLFVTSPSLTAAFDKDCEQLFNTKKHPGISLRFSIIKPQLKFDNSQNKLSLTKLSDEYANNPNVSVNGLTKARFDATIDGDFIMIPLKNRHTCVLPREIRVVLG